MPEMYFPSSLREVPRCVEDPLKNVWKKVRTTLESNLWDLPCKEYLAHHRSPAVFTVTLDRQLPSHTNVDIYTLGGSKVASYRLPGEATAQQLHDAFLQDNVHPDNRLHILVLDETGQVELAESLAGRQDLVIQLDVCFALLKIPVALLEDGRDFESSLNEIFSDLGYLPHTVHICGVWRDTQYVYLMRAAN